MCSHPAWRLHPSTIHLRSPQGRFEAKQPCGMRARPLAVSGIGQCSVGVSCCISIRQQAVKSLRMSNLASGSFAAQQRNRFQTYQRPGPRSHGALAQLGRTTRWSLSFKFMKFSPGHAPPARFRCLIRERSVLHLKLRESRCAVWFDDRSHCRLLLPSPWPQLSRALVQAAFT